MSLIIDGYNVMHISRFAPTSNATKLKTLRNRFLRHLSERIDPRVHKSIKVVFDSERKKSSESDRFTFHHLKIFFARDHLTADDLIIEMIQANNVPKKLTVVSSDHRIQVAAKRKRARFVDSDVWYDALPEQPLELPDLSTSSKQLDQVSSSDGQETAEPKIQKQERSSNPTGDVIRRDDDDPLFDMDELESFEKRLRNKETDGR